MTETRKLLLEKDGPIGWIVFNQPEKRNAVSQEMWQLMPEYVDELSKDDAIRVVILRGAGEQAGRVRVVAGPIRRDADHLQPSCGLRLRSAPAAAQVPAERLGDLVPHGVRRVERRARLLGDVADDAVDLLRREELDLVREVGIDDLHLARVDPIDLGECRPDRRRGFRGDEGDALAFQILRCLDVRRLQAGVPEAAQPLDDFHVLHRRAGRGALHGRVRIGEAEGVLPGSDEVVRRA